MRKRNSNSRDLIISVVGGVVGTVIVGIAAATLSGDWDALRTVITSGGTAVAVVAFALIGAGLALWLKGHRWAVTMWHRTHRHQFDREVFLFQAVGLALVLCGALLLFRLDPPSGWDRIFK